MSKRKTKTIECLNCGAVVDDALRNMQVEGVKFTATIPFCDEKCEKLYEKAKAEEERANQILIKKTKIIPAKFVNVDTDKKDELKKYYGKSLYAHGDIGVGKTVFMSSMCKKYIDEGKDVLWYSYPGLVMQLKGMFSENFSQSPYKLAEHIANYPGVVAIDDLGVEKQTEFVQEITYYIVNQREINDRLLLVTSNLHPSMLENRVASRLIGMCSVVRFSGKDRRKMK